MKIIIRHELVSKALQQLSERERAVVAHRFGLNGQRRKSLAETGKELGMTRERVRVIEQRAVDYLRNHHGVTL